MDPGHSHKAVIFPNMNFVLCVNGGNFSEISAKVAVRTVRYRYRVRIFTQPFFSNMSIGLYIYENISLLSADQNVFDPYE
jgi:hypothetical protein